MDHTQTHKHKEQNRTIWYT